jgi:hypothetical protein
MVGKPEVGPRVGVTLDLAVWLFLFARLVCAGADEAGAGKKGRVNGVWSNNIEFEANFHLNRCN